MIGKASKIAIMREIVAKKIFTVSSSDNRDTWNLLKDGSRAPIFFDTRKFNSYPELSAKIINRIIDMIEEEHIVYDKIMGLPYGGLLFSYGIVTILRVPCLSMRKEGKKKYTTTGDLLGLRKKGDRVLLIEDATVTAKTAVGFVKRLHEDGLVVEDLITILDVEKHAEENLKKVGVLLHPVFTCRELYETYLQTESVTPKMRKIISENFVITNAIQKNK